MTRENRRGKAGEGVGTAMNTTVYENGEVPAGQYGELRTFGTVSIADDVSFESLSVQGVATAHNVHGGVLVVDGTLIVSGSLRVHTLGGNGELRVAGSVRTGRMQFTGLMQTERELRVIDSLDVSGILRNGKRVDANTVDVDGFMDVTLLHAVHTVRIEPLDTMMLSWECFRQYDHVSTAGSITCMDLEARDLSCAKLKARTVTLRGNSYVQDVNCAKTLTMDRSSVALQVSGGCERITLNE